MKNTPLQRLRHHVTGAIERGEAKAIAGIPAPVSEPVYKSRFCVRYDGFIQTVERLFATREGAERWARQAGVSKRCTISEVVS